MRTQKLGFGFGIKTLKPTNGFIGMSFELKTHLILTFCPNPNPQHNFYLSSHIFILLLDRYLKITFINAISIYSFKKVPNFKILF